MGRPVLLLRLEGPLQSWGLRSRWDTRDTNYEPTKSGVLGLIGCALGYPACDPRLEELDRRLRFGVRVERPGSVIKDYQTVTDFLSSADGRFRCNGTETRPNLEKLRSTPETTPFTVISPRYYLEDAAFLTALEEYGEGQDLLVECAEALRKPRWPIYLGRKACVPTRPVLESLTSEYGGIDDALSRYPWSCLGNEYRVRKEQPSLVLGYVEDPLGDRTLQDAVRTNQARRYDMRQVRRFTVNFE